MTVKLLGLVFCAGVAAHILLFRKSEWDRYSPVLVLTYALLNTSIFSIFVLTSNHSFLRCLVKTSLISCALVTGIFASILVYRLLFHPLREFPGPLGARISSAWTFREQWPDLRLYIKLRRIHNRYGDFVRIKPRELSICSADAINDILGPKNVMRKGEFYEQIHPAHSLQFNRNSNQHKNQRRFWDKAFQTQAIKEYTPRIVKHYKSFMTVIIKDAGLGIPVDMSKISMDLFFDVISDLTLGASYNALATDQRHPNVREFVRRQKSVGFVLLNMWVFHLIRSIPAVVRQLSYMMRWSASVLSGGGEVREILSRKHKWYTNALENRKEMRDILPDLYTYLSQSKTFQVDGIHEAQLAIIAGADTNSITVSNVCYLLCQHPEYQQKLLTEISNLPISEDIIDDQHLIGKPCLLSIINETLRLYPPVPGGLQRLTPPQGAIIAGRYIPGNMVVSTPTYALQRDPRSFVRPDDFVPERWTSQPDLILGKEAFVPFSYGAYSCAGKPLAMMQLRMVIAMIVRKFELRFAPGQQEVYERYIQDQADCFTLHLHPLPIVLKERISKH